MQKKIFVTALLFSSLLGANDLNIFALKNAAETKQLSLKQVLEIAIKNNFDLQKGQLKTDIEQLKTHSLAANLLPKISAGIHVLEQSSEHQEKSDQVRAGLKAQVPLIDPELWLSIRAQKEIHHQASANYLHEKNLLIKKVADAYVLALTAFFQKEIQKVELDLSRSQLSLIEKQKKAGLVRDLDLSRAKYQVDKARSDLLTKENLFNQSIGHVGALAVMEDNFMPSDVTIDSPILTLPIGQIKTLALDSPFMEQSKRSLSAAKINLARQSMSFLPKVSASFESLAPFEFENNSMKGLGPSTNRVMVNLEIPLFMGGKRIFETKQAVKEKTIASLAVDQSSDLIEKSLQAVLAQIVTQTQEIKSSQSALNAALLAQESAERLFKNAALTTLELFEANKDRFNAEANLRATRLKLEQSKIYLLFLCNRLNDLLT